MDSEAVQAQLRSHPEPWTPPGVPGRQGCSHCPGAEDEGGRGRNRGRAGTPGRKGARQDTQAGRDQPQADTTQQCRTALKHTGHTAGPTPHHALWGLHTHTCSQGTHAHTRPPQLQGSSQPRPSSRKARGVTAQAPAGFPRPSPAAQTPAGPLWASLNVQPCTAQGPVPQPTLGRPCSLLGPQTQPSNPLLSPSLSQTTGREGLSRDHRHRPLLRHRASVCTPGAPEQSQTSVGTPGIRTPTGHRAPAAASDDLGASQGLALADPLVRAQVKRSPTHSHFSPQGCPAQGAVGGGTGQAGKWYPHKCPSHPMGPRN